jgi:hypothetical protein
MDLDALREDLRRDGRDEMGGGSASDGEFEGALDDDEADDEPGHATRARGGR